MPDRVGADLNLIRRTLDCLGVKAAILRAPTPTDEVTLVQVSAALAESVGRAPCELAAQPVAAITHRFGPDFCVDALTRRLLHDGQFETNVVLADGQREGAWSIQVSSLDKAGDAQTWLWIEHDLTLGALRLACDALDEGLFVKDADGRYLYVNDAYARLLGRKPADLLGRVDAELFDADRGANFEEADRAAIARGAADARKETRVVSGVTHKVLTTRTPRRDQHGNICGVVGVTHDFTELSEAQAKLKRAEHLASIGALAAGIAHEVNNPVGGILLSAQNAINETHEGGNAEYVRRCLGDIAMDAKRCGRVVQSIMRFVRQLPSEKAECALNDAVKHAVATYAEEAGGAGVAISLALAEAAPRVELNVTEFEQALINLLRNAAQHGGPGVRAVVSTAVAGHHVRITVADDGPGMTEQEAAAVFEPFHMTRSSRGGAGLGLSVVRGVIEAHGGAVSVTTRPGAGAAFHIDLPLLRGGAGDGRKGRRPAAFDPVEPT